MMKQQITIQQFNELSTDNQCQLWDWWEEHGYLKRAEIDGHFEKVEPLMSIGQMIEFLWENWINSEFTIKIHRKGRIYLGGRKQMGQLVIKDKRLRGHFWLCREEGGDFFATEHFCDCLWEVVKEILEK